MRPLRFGDKAGGLDRLLMAAAGLGGGGTLALTRLEADGAMAGPAIGASSWHRATV